ncbi:unnamed protein product [Sphacelaria rigidula]
MHRARTKLVTELRDKGLLIGNGLIGGRWVPAASGREFKVFDPAVDDDKESEASGVRVVLQVSEMGAEDAALAVEAAQRSAAAWRGTNMQVRTLKRTSAS